MCFLCLKRKEHGGDRQAQTNVTRPVSELFPLVPYSTSIDGLRVRLCLRLSGNPCAFGADLPDDIGWRNMGAAEWWLSARGR
jgi:hypothetical protein